MLKGAALLILTALCTALPARVGLIVIGARPRPRRPGGGLGRRRLRLVLRPADRCRPRHGVRMLAGGLLILTVGALRYYRGVNETISSLLIAYIAIAAFNYLIEASPATRPPSPSTHLDSG